MIASIGRMRGKQCTDNESRAYSMCSGSFAPEVSGWACVMISNAKFRILYKYYGDVPVYEYYSRRADVAWLLSNSESQLVNINNTTLTFYLTLQWHNTDGEYYLV